jgi:hypothetical protein
MEEPIIEQFLKEIESWKPDETTSELFRKALKKGNAPSSHVEALAVGLMMASQATYGYLEAVHRLAALPSLDRKSFVQRLAQMVEVVEALKKGHAAYRNAFQAYHAEVQGGLVHARFDTTYYDAIQNFDVKSVLKNVLQDVDLLLKSFALVSADLAGVKCLDLYEDCVRFQLYGHYLTLKTPMTLEECWSILFDLNGLFSSGGADDPGEDLEDFREELESVRRKNNS